MAWFFKISLLSDEDQWVFFFNRVKVLGMRFRNTFWCINTPDLLSVDFNLFPQLYLWGDTLLAGRGGVENAFQGDEFSLSKWHQWLCDCGDREMREFLDDKAQATWQFCLGASEGWCQLKDTLWLRKKNILRPIQLHHWELGKVAAGFPDKSVQILPAMEKGLKMRNTIHPGFSSSPSSQPLCLLDPRLWREHVTFSTPAPLTKAEGQLGLPGVSAAQTLGY